MGFWKRRRINKIIETIKTLNADCAAEIAKHNAITGTGMSARRRRKKHFDRANEISGYILYWKERYKNETGAEYVDEYDDDDEFED